MPSKKRDSVDSLRRAAIFGGLAGLAASPLQAMAQPSGQSGGSARRSLRLEPTGSEVEDGAILRSALTRFDAARQGAFTVNFEEGTYRLAGSGRALLAVQTGTRLLGGALEGTQFRVASDATATSALSDDTATRDGSAAKIELYNLTINGGGNRHLTAVFDLGTDGSVPFGTYGRIDNLLARDAPNATAFNLSVNIVAVGDLYSLDTRDGLVTADGGSGCHVRSVYPYGWSRYGIRLGGIGDSVLNGEGEAPTSNDAVYVYGSRSFIVGLGSHLISVAQDTTIKRPFVIDTATVGDWALGPWHFVRSHRTQRYGDFDNPTYRGTATGVGANTLVDARQNWELDELKGWAIKILSGPGADNWAEIAGNTRDTIEISSRSWTSSGPALEAAPATGSRYAVAPALCAASGGGFASSRVLTLAEAVVRRLFARALRVGSLRIGASNAAADLQGILRTSARFSLGALAVRGRERRTITLGGVRPGNFVTVSAPDLRALDVSVEADAGNDEIVVWVENRGSRATSPLSVSIGLLVVQVS